MIGREVIVFSVDVSILSTKRHRISHEEGEVKFETLGAEARSVDHVGRYATIVTLNDADLYIIVVVAKECRIKSHTTVHEGRLHAEFHASDRLFGVFIAAHGSTIKVTAIEAASTVTRGVARIEVGVIIHGVLCYQTARDIAEALLVVVAIDARCLWNVHEVVYSPDVTKG